MNEIDTRMLNYNDIRIKNAITKAEKRYTPLSDEQFNIMLTARNKWEEEMQTKSQMALAIMKHYLVEDLVKKNADGAYNKAGVVYTARLPEKYWPTAKQNEFNTYIAQRCKYFEFYYTRYRSGDITDGDVSIISSGVNLLNMIELLALFACLRPFKDFKDNYMDKGCIANTLVYTELKSRMESSIKKDVFNYDFIHISNVSDLNEEQLALLTELKSGTTKTSKPAMGGNPVQTRVAINLGDIKKRRQETPEDKAEREAEEQKVKKKQQEIEDQIKQGTKVTNEAKTALEKALENHNRNLDDKNNAEQQKTDGVDSYFSVLTDTN
jgi:hypothetical protein